MKSVAGRRSGVSPRSGAGFTLVEVVAALGVVTFTLTAVVGLLALALAQERQSREETHMTHIASEVFANLQSRGAFDEGIDVTGKPTPSVQLLTANAGTAYYSGDEQLVNAGDTSVQYKVAASVVPVTVPPVAPATTPQTVGSNVVLTITATDKATQTFIQTLGNF